LEPRTPLSSAIRIEVVTVLWMIVEAGLSIGAGIHAGSVALVAFGADSVIELVSAVTLLWRLDVEKREAHVTLVQAAENRAAWITGYALVALSLYIVIAAAHSLMEHESAESSAIGIAVSAAAVLIMPALGIRKRKLAKEINSAALRADAACSLTCGYMAAALLVGLAVNALTGWWWIDSVVSLALLYWLIPEAKEAFEGAKRGEARCSCE
jgi:divalent metal cation (Fe/Co/Zn/Cd) transporter